MCLRIQFRLPSAKRPVQLSPVRRTNFGNSEHRAHTHYSQFPVGVRFRFTNYLLRHTYAISRPLYARLLIFIVVNSTFNGKSRRSGRTSKKLVFFIRSFRLGKWRTGLCWTIGFHIFPPIFFLLLKFHFVFVRRCRRRRTQRCGRNPCIYSN